MRIAHGEFVAIVGPTGCGKSTLLNVAAGLLKPASGAVRIFDAPLAGLNREAGYLFQADALFPWKTAIDNVAIGLEIQGAPRAEALERAQAWLTSVGLGAFGNRYPHMLSGGQRKRVGLAQVLIRDPKILLMDEPFGPLDAQTRQIMGNLLLELWNADRKAVLFVTHDLEEAIALADRVVIMSAGPGARIIGDWRVPLPRPRDISEVRLDEGVSRAAPGDLERAEGRGDEGLCAIGGRLRSPAGTDDNETRGDVMLLRGSILAVAVALAAMCGSHAALAQGVFTLSSPDFKDGARLALKNAGNNKANPNCVGENISPALSWANPPEGTKSYALLMFDPEGRPPGGVSHWVAYGIPVAVTGFAEGEVSKPSDKYVGGIGTEKLSNYTGPCTPAGPPHHYTFTLIATDLEPAALPPGLTRDELIKALDGHAKAATGLIGMFSKP